MAWRAPRGWPRLLALGAATLLVVACAVGPVSVSKVDPAEAYREQTRNVLASGAPSGPTETVLQEEGLVERFKETPEAALAELHRAVVEDRRGPDAVFALAELSFLHAGRTAQRPHYLAAAVYAWAFLFPETGGPDAFDPRLRLAAELYNGAVAAAFETPDGSEMALGQGVFELPFGTLDVTLDESRLTWHGRRFDRFIPVRELEVRGIRSRYRRPGIGVPLAAASESLDTGVGAGEIVGPRVLVPVTALLQLDGLPASLRTGRLEGRLEIHAAADGDTIPIRGRPVPLSSEPTASLAYSLARTKVLRTELQRLLAGDVLEEGGARRLIAISPYQPGRIPVVFVHGTASSPARWADMFNRLDNDRRIRERYQFWFFQYDTGNPIVYSALLLRESLEHALGRLDPEGRDPALHRMVVVGHSQGGLLAKMTVVESGDQLWENVSHRPLRELLLTDRTRDLLRRAFFVEPLPFVRRVVFIATPHRGSYVAGWSPLALLTRLFRLPGDVLTTAGELLTNSDALAFDAVGGVPTSIHNMSPGNAFVRALATIPVAPGIPVHSIVCVKGDGPPEDGSDGVVRYESAHLAAAESELIVRWTHSCQGRPETVAEVRRLLLAHLEQG